MLEKEKIRFFDTERLTETKDFSAHCKTSYLQSALKDVYKRQVPGYPGCSVFQQHG